MEEGSESECDKEDEDEDEYSQRFEGLLYIHLQYHITIPASSASSASSTTCTTDSSLEASMTMCLLRSKPLSI